MESRETPLLSVRRSVNRKVLLWRTGKLSLGNKGEEVQRLGFT